MMTGARALARMLHAYGVTHVFMVPAVLRRTLAEMERFGIQRIHTHGEKPAAYMADGYARMAGRPGVCLAQVVGALNLAAGLRDAYLAHSPVIAMTGGRHPTFRGLGVYQEVDDLPAFTNVTKFNRAVDRVERIPDLVRSAFRSAVSGCPGPVHLQFAGNEGQVELEEADLDPYIEEGFSRLPPFRPCRRTQTSLLHFPFWTAPGVRSSWSEAGCEPREPPPSWLVSPRGFRFPWPPR